MNIGIVTTWFERGAAYVSRAYMKTLNREHNVFIYARAGERYAQGDPKWDADYVTWGKRVQGKVDTHIDWDDFSLWLEQNSIDIVLFNEQQSWDVIVRMRRQSSTRIGAYIDYYTPRTVPFFGLYDFLLCNTQRHYSVFKEHPQSYYLPWGTDISVFGNNQEQSEGVVTFFHSAGMDMFRKGTNLVVSAFGQLQGEAKLVIHSQRSLKESGFAQTVTSDSRIEFIQAEVGPPGLYHLGDVYVYPARLDGIGLTIAEALASGCPVITTDVAPMNEFVKEGINGKLVRVERLQRRQDDYYWPEAICNEDSLVQAMQFYVDNSQRIQGLKQEAAAYAHEFLDWNKNSAELLTIVSRVAQSERSVDSKLLQEAERYERLRYPGTVRKLLIKMGAGALKRKLKSALSGP
jgi:glycosyltransferase involved in cell wall biosynthesis